MHFVKAAKTLAGTIIDFAVKAEFFFATALFAPHVRANGFRNPENFGLWNLEPGKIILLESEILGSEIGNTVQGVRDPTNDKNPES